MDLHALVRERLARSVCLDDLLEPAGAPTPLDSLQVTELWCMLEELGISVHEADLPQLQAANRVDDIVIFVRARESR